MKCSIKNCKGCKDCKKSFNTEIRFNIIKNVIDYIKRGSDKPHNKSDK